MNSLLLLLALLVFAATASLLHGRLHWWLELRRTWPYYVRRLMSPPEQVLYHRLACALPENIVFAQVQVSRVLGVKRGYSFREWNNRIDRLSFDFVVCGRDARVIAVIELDDRTHERASRVRTDAKKNKSAADASLRLVRWNVQALPTDEAIRAEILAGWAAPVGDDAPRKPTRRRS